MSWLLLASLSTAAMAQTAAPPWSVEAPGAAGSTFGLGLDLFSERQERLEIGSSESTVTVQGRGETIPGDPELLNRKFDMRWDLEGVGVQIPIALPGIGRRLYPTLILQAASVDVALDFLDRSREGDSTSLEGRGEVFGVGLDLVAPLGRRRLFAVGSYRFQKLPDLGVHRSPSFATPGAEVLHDEVQLSRQVQDLSLRVGYGFPGGRFATYLGARSRWMELEVADELRFVDANRRETSLTSRTELDGEEVFGFAGLDVRVWGPLYGRAEATFGGDDRSALLKVVYLWPRGAGGGPASGSPSGEEPGETGDGPGTSEDEEIRPLAPAEEAELERREAQIADAIAPRIRSIHSDFSSARSGPSAPVSLGAARELLDRMERALLEALRGTELAAMRDYVQDRFGSARELLTRSPEQALLDPLDPKDAFAPAVARGVGRTASVRAALQRADDTQSIESAFDLVQGVLDRLVRLFENDDLLVNTCFRTQPATGARIEIQPRSYPPGVRKLRATNGELRTVWRGLYVHQVSRSGYRTINCLPGSPARAENCDPLDLVMTDRPWVICDLHPARPGECFVQERPSRRWRCEADGR